MSLHASLLASLVATLLATSLADSLAAHLQLTCKFSPTFTCEFTFTSTCKCTCNIGSSPLQRMGALDKRFLALVNAIIFGCLLWATEKCKLNNGFLATIRNILATCWPIFCHYNSFELFWQILQSAFSIQLCWRAVAARGVVCCIQKSRKKKVHNEK